MLAPGDPARAATLAGCADAGLGRQRYERESTETTTFERSHAILAERLDEGQRTRLITAGASLTSEAALALALAVRADR